MSDDEIDLGDIISQLRQSQVSQPRYKEEDEEELTSENIDSFLLKNAGQLVKDSIESVGHLKDALISAPDAENAEALASLVGSTTNAIDIIQKMVANRDKIKATKEITQMKIDSQQVQTDKEISAKLLMSREEMFARLLEASLSEESPEKIATGEIIDQE